MQNKYDGMYIRLNRPLLNPIERRGRNILRFFSPYRIKRLDGISAITLLRDEPLAFESVGSILPFVDEVIIVDSSRSKPKLPESNKIVYIHAPPEQDSQFKIGILLSKYRWLLRWDGDFLPVNGTGDFIEQIRNIKKGYWQVKCLVANVDDKSIDYLQKEQYVFTFHPEIFTANYKILTKIHDVLATIRGGMKCRICYGMLPYFFGQKDIDVVFANHHYKQKSKERLVERKFQAQWSLLSDVDRASFSSFEKYVDMQLRKEESG